MIKDTFTPTHTHAHTHKHTHVMHTQVSSGEAIKNLDAQAQGEAMIRKALAELKLWCVYCLHLPLRLLVRLLSAPASASFGAFTVCTCICIFLVRLLSAPASESFGAFTVCTCLCVFWCVYCLHLPLRLLVRLLSAPASASVGLTCIESCMPQFIGKHSGGPHKPFVNYIALRMWDCTVY